MKSRVRLTPDDRRAQIVAALMACATETDYRLVTREAVGARANCAPPLVSSYLGTLAEIRELAVSNAIELGNLRVIGQAMAARHPLTRRLPFATKLAAASALLGLPPLRAN